MKKKKKNLWIWCIIFYGSIFRWTPWFCFFRSKKDSSCNYAWNLITKMIQRKLLYQKINFFVGFEQKKKKKSKGRKRKRISIKNGKIDFISFAPFHNLCGFLFMVCVAHFHDLCVANHKKKHYPTPDKLSTIRERFRHISSDKSR